MCSRIRNLSDIANVCALFESCVRLHLLETRLRPLFIESEPQVACTSSVHTHTHPSAPPLRSPSSSQRSLRDPGGQRVARQHRLEQSCLRRHFAATVLAAIEAQGRPHARRPQGSESLGVNLSGPNEASKRLLASFLSTPPPTEDLTLVLSGGRLRRHRGQEPEVCGPNAQRVSSALGHDR